MWAIVNGVKEKVSICGSSVFISIVREMLYLVNICMQKSLRARVHMQVSASMAYILINNGSLLLILLFELCAFCFLNGVLISCILTVPILMIISISGWEFQS